MDDETKKKLVVLDKRLLLAQLKSNIARGERDVAGMSASIIEQQDNIRQWNNEILKVIADLKQLGVEDVTR